MAQESPEPGGLRRGQRGQCRAASRLLVAGEVQTGELGVVKQGLIPQRGGTRRNADDPRPGECCSSSRFLDLRSRPADRSARADRDRTPFRFFLAGLDSVASASVQVIPRHRVLGIEVLRTSRLQPHVRLLSSRSASFRHALDLQRTQEPAQNRRGGKGQERRRDGRRRTTWRPRSQNGDAPRPDRLAVEETLEVVGQRPGPIVALCRVLVQALQADRLQVARARRGTSRDGGTGSSSMTWRTVSSARLALEGRPAGQHLVEDRPQRVDVGRRADVRGCPAACSGAM